MASGTTSLGALPTNPAMGNPGSNPVTMNNSPPQQNMQRGSPPQQNMQRGPPPQQNMQRGPPPQQNMHHGSPPRQQHGTTSLSSLRSRADNTREIKSTSQENNMEKLNNDLSNAKNTKLPPRDIPMNTQRITQDIKARPNSLGKKTLPSKNTESPKEDFVKNYETAATIKEKNAKKQEKKETIDYLYDELQAPILIGFLFFILQLPFVRKKIMTLFPFLFLKDGNMNMSGFVVLSMTFGLMYYGIQKLLQQFTTIKI